MLALAAVAAAGTAAHAQDIPTVISPLRVETDHNGVNLVSGRTRTELPVLSVPGAPNLRFDRIQNAAPYVSGRVTGGPGDYPVATYSVHTGMGSSESFTCPDYDCTSVTGTGSTFLHGSRTYRQAGSAARWHYIRKHVDTVGPPRVLLYYASHVDYPNGETITYTHETAYLPNDPFNRTFYRTTRITSNLGYHIDLSYHPGALGEMGWNSVAQATLFAAAAPNTPLGRLSYSADSGTITDHGNRALNDPAGRVYQCTGCANGLGSDIEVAAGSIQLPGEGTPSQQIAAHPSATVVASVTRDGVPWTYSYLNLRPEGAPQTWLFDRVTVSGPNGFNQVYNVAQVGLGPQARNVITSTIDSIGRTSSYLFDEGYRPYRVVSPEGNQVDVSYDEYGNIPWRRTRAKPGSGLADIIETAYFPTDTCFYVGTPIMCYRPLWSRDGLNRQTDYAYNALGQLIEQTDPADANGVRRRTSITYATSAGGLSRRSAVVICGIGTTCGTNAEIRTEYQYWGETSLPALERRRDLATGQQLDTTYEYNAAGRLTSTDGPLAGSDDATYKRYDLYGRTSWEIGPRGPNSLRIATRFTYRDSDDKPSGTETGTLPDAASTNLTVLNRTDFAYDSRRNKVRETVSANGTSYSVVQRSFDDQARLECEARRMNPAIFASLPASACTLGTQGTGANAFGPDRITRNIYDSAGQLLQVQRAYGVTTANGFPTTLQQNYATYTYSPNGKQTSVTDANGNRAELTWDGHDRPRRWIFPSPTTPGVANQADYEEYGHDLVGNRTSLRKRDGSTLTYQYDALNRMIVKIVPERAGLAVTHTRDVHYGYDLRSLEIYARFDSSSGEGVSNAYDAFGQQISSTSTLDGVTRALSYQYDGAGNRTRVTHPDGQAFTYAHDALGRLSGVYEGVGTAVPLDQLTYNALALPASRSERNGSSVSYGYDPIGRLNSQTDAFVGGTGNITFGFSHNPAGQIISRSRNNDAYASNTAYNVSRGYTVNGLNQYTVAGGASFAYDANGNLIADGTRTFAYDVENRLVTVGGAASATLRYDPHGRLYEVSGASGTTRFLHDGDALVGEYNSAGAMTARFVHGSNVESDDPLVWYDGGSTRWLHADHQGSIVAATNTSGATQWINAYDEWGIPNAANQGRFQYTGQAWIPELGMYYYKARMYSPTLGRFLQTDPVGYEDQINLYAYAGNDPVNGMDFSGKCHTDPDTQVQTGICGRGDNERALVARMIANPASNFARVEADAIKAGKLINLSYVRFDRSINGAGTEAGVNPGDSNVFIDVTDTAIIENLDDQGTVVSSRVQTIEEMAEHEISGHAYDAVLNPDAPRGEGVSSETNAIDAENRYRERSGINFRRNHPPNSRGVICDSHGQQCRR